MNTYSLDGQVVLISGSEGRLGRAFAEAILEEGGKVCLLDVSEQIKHPIVSKFESSRAIFVRGDATLREDVDSAIQACTTQFDRFDAAIHCAYPRSSHWGRRFEDLEPIGLGEDLMNQLGGAIIFSQRVINAFRKHGGGSLIHVSSIQGIANPKFHHYAGTEMTSPIEYSAIKSGVISITRYLAKYCRQEGIRVNCISPGGLNDRQPAEFLERYRNECSSKGMLDGVDIASALVFLLSPGAHYITGQNIVVDDGWSL